MTATESLNDSTTEADGNSFDEIPPAPWGWLNLGGRWQLFGTHGRRPVVLAAGRGLKLRTRDSKSGLLVDITPEHPIARLIESSPDLYAACVAGIEAINSRDDLMNDTEREAMALLVAATGRVRGESEVAE